MSLRPWCLVICLVVGSCGGAEVDPDEPTTAREKMRREAKRDKKNKDEPVDSTGKQWGKWRYSGDRADCFFRFGQKCFKTEAAACSAAKCKAPTKCRTEGAGPADVSCKK